ncbi:hypothetical protein [Pseudomonas jessenii]|jgi:hypothetical protein|uniref:hypothetical protein n=1 Tax=Pseudomonas jessenii TaxID=77298 RepID=UPI0030C06294
MKAAKFLTHAGTVATTGAHRKRALILPPIVETAAQYSYRQQMLKALFPEPRE